MRIRANILYAPPPDGDDASISFASRASTFFTTQPHGDAAMQLGHVGPLTASEKDSGGEGLPWRTAPSGDDADSADDADRSATPSLTLFLISCAADGAVHRSVRKTMRALKLASSAEETSRNQAIGAAAATVPTAGGGVRYYALAALGHARCENSANQMADAIFGTGRRFDKALAGSGFFHNAGGASSCTVPRLETQVELCGPETEFDPWLELLLQKVVEDCSK